MGLRQFIEKSKHQTLGVAVGLIVIAAFVSWRSIRANRLDGPIERIYFSDDDGKTYFADDVAKGFSFSRNGKTAYRAFVYRCGSEGPFVGLLARASDQPAPSRPGAPPPSDARVKGNRGAPVPFEIRKPGTTAWALANSPEGQVLLNDICKDGTPETVLP